jgi:hypothetical protein
MSREVFKPIIEGDIKFAFYDDNIQIQFPNKFAYYYDNLGIANVYYDNVAISFDDKKYKRIYESLKEKMAKKYHYWEKSKAGEVIPDIYKIPPTDFSKWTKEDLIKWIESSNCYKPDLRHSFDSSMFKVKYTNCGDFYDIDETKKIKAYRCTNLRHGGRVCINDTFEIEDFGKVISNNRAFILKFLECVKCSHLHSITVSNIHYTDELIVPHFFIKGVFKR